jgi:hypothetical protein
MKARRDRAMAVLPPALSGRERYERFVRADVERGRAMAAEQALSSAEVARVILKDVDRRRGEDGAWSIEPRPVRGRDSWVFKAHTPSAPWPLAVKVHCAAVTPEDVAAKGDHLRAYHERMAGSPQFTVPAFWACLPRHRTLVMQWIEAPRMDDLLRRAGRDERSRLFAAAGAWLRQYHAQSEAVVRPLRLRSNPRHIDMLLGGEEGVGRQVRDGVFRSAYETLVEQTDAFARHRVAHVMAHGDFVPHNVFHGGGHTVAFDMVPRMRPALHDIWHFLVHAEVTKPLMARAKLGATGIARQDVQAFLEAYGTLEHLGGEAVAAYMQLNEVLLRWAVMIAHLRRGGRRRPEHLISWVRYRRMANGAAEALRRGGPRVTG